MQTNIAASFPSHNTPPAHTRTHVALTLPPAEASSAGANKQRTNFPPPVATSSEGAKSPSHHAHVAGAVRLHMSMSTPVSRRRADSLWQHRRMNELRTTRLATTARVVPKGIVAISAEDCVGAEKGKVQSC